MSSSDTTNIKMQVLQLASRLEDASSNERLEAIQTLHSLARLHAKLVGEHSLPKLLEILREHGSIEEYQDVLDLITRLISSKDKAASADNADILLSENRNVDLLLDMLEHEDMTIGVMTSLILSEIHHLHGTKLEAEIQKCPEGMSKLLRRLPDTSREEVRDQAIVFVQQLTHNNEEMKKNFVFNEGFEIIFRIIKHELTRSSEVTIVVQDCLLICCHVLTGSEICQRLFYGMGLEWIDILGQFFDPDRLDSYKPILPDDDSDLRRVSHDVSWYDDVKMLSCSVLALAALANSLALTNTKHQDMFISSTSSRSRSLLSCASYWLARRGPSLLLDKVFAFLVHIIKHNPTIAHNVSTLIIHMNGPNLPGKSIPTHAEAASLHYAWKPYHDQDRRYITLPSLLIERYIYRGIAWPATTQDTSSTSTAASLSVNGSSYDSSTMDGMMHACLHVIETWLEADSTLSDLIIQYCIAPPPPLPEEFDDDGNLTIESSKPIGKHLFILLLESVNRLININTNNAIISAAVTSSHHHNDVELVERACNIITIIFVYGTNLARELSTAMMNNHLGLGSTSRIRPVLSYLLSSAGILVKASSSSSSSVIAVVAMMRLLATAASSCERVTRMLFEDPSNLFIIDLASTSSENAGISSLIQLSSCFLIGCCYQSLAKPSSSSSPSSDDALSRVAFMNMIDSRIGLQRFTDILKQPLQLSSSASLSTSSVSSSSSYFFDSIGFKRFYEAQVQMIRKDIFEHYTGSISSSSSTSSSSSSYEHIIHIQQERIAELESLLSSSSSSSSVVIQDDELSTRDAIIAELRQAATTNDMEYDSMQKLLHDQAEHIILLEAQLSSLSSSPRSSSSSSSSVMIQDDDAMISYKQQILSLLEEKQHYLDAMHQRDKMMALLQAEASSSASSCALYEKKAAELEARNSELKQQVWMMESDAKDKDAIIHQLSSSSVISSVALSDMIPSSSVMVSSYNDDEYKGLIKAFQDLISCLPAPVHDDDIPASYDMESFYDDQLPLPHHLHHMHDIIIDVTSCINQLADRFSDMVQSSSTSYHHAHHHDDVHHMIVFHSAERSFARVDECVEKLMMMIHDADDQHQLLSSSLSDAEAEKASIIRMNERLEDDMKMMMIAANNNLPSSSTSSDGDDEMMRLKDHLSSLQQQYDALLSSYDEEKTSSMKAQVLIQESLKQEQDRYHHLSSSYDDVKQQHIIDMNMIHDKVEMMKIQYDAQLRDATSALADYKRDYHHRQLSYEQQIHDLQQLHDDDVKMIHDLQQHHDDHLHDQQLHHVDDVKMIHDMEMKIDAMDALLIKREAEMQSSYDEVAKHAEERIMMLQHDHDDKIHDAKSQYDAMIHDHDIMIHDMKQQYDDMKQRYDAKIQHMIDDDHIMIHDMKQKYDGMMHEYDAKIQHLTDEHQMKMISYDDKMKEYEVMLHDKDVMVRELEEKRRALVEDMMVMEADHDKRFDMLHKESYDVMQALDKLSQEYDAYKHHHHDKDDDEDMKKQYEDRIYELEHEISSMKSSYEMMIHDHKTSSDEMMMKLKQQYDADKDEMKKMMMIEVDHIRSQEQLISHSLQQQLEASSLQLIITNDKMMQVKFDDDHMMEREAMISSLRGEKQALQQQYDDMMMMHDDDMKQQYDDMKKIHDDLMMMHHADHHRVQEVDAEAAALRGEKHAIKQQYDDMMIKYDAIMKKYDDVKMIHDDDMKIKYDAMIKKYDDVVKQHDDMKSKYDALMMKYDAKKMKYDAMKSHRDAIKSQYDDLMMIHDEMKHQYDDKMMMHDDTKHQYDALKSQYDAMLKQHDDGVKKIVSLEQQVGVKQKVIEGLKAQLQHEKVNTSDLREQLSSLQDDVSLLKLLQMEILSLEPWFRDHHRLEVSLAPYINTTTAILIVKQAIERLSSASYHQHHHNNISSSSVSYTPIKPKHSPASSPSSSSSSAMMDSMLMTTLPYTPEQTSSSHQHHHNNHHHHINNNHRDVMESEGKWSSSSKRSSSRMMPSSKRDMLRIQAEILRERKKLISLQEEHNDLLGLLAQQEVELSVMRDAMERSLGADYVMTVDEEAMRIALDRYGNYINFRQAYDDEGEEDPHEHEDHDVDEHHHDDDEDHHEEVEDIGIGARDIAQE